MRALKKIFLWGLPAAVVLAFAGFGFLLYYAYRFIEDNGLVRPQVAVDTFEKGCFQTIVGAVRPTDVDDAMIAKGLDPTSNSSNSWRHPLLRMDSALLSRDDGGADCLITFLPGYMGLNMDKPDHAARKAFADYANGRFERGMTEVDAAILNLEAPSNLLSAQPLVMGFEGDLYRYYLAFEPRGDGHLTYRLVSTPLPADE